MHTMEYKGYKASIMRARRLTGDYVHELPTGTPIEVFAVDQFEEPLPNWITGAGNYVVPIESDWGLWFNWTMNDHLNTCVLPTVKGMNPITGRRTNGYALERYEDKCPIHEEKFKDGLYCEKCDFKWPNQNYVAYPNILWWDGFRTSDGKVRQFFFTEDLARSIPEKVIGKEDTVPAFGFAFYRPKILRRPEPRPIIQQHIHYSFQDSFQEQVYGCCDFSSDEDSDSSSQVYYSNSNSSTGGIICSGIPQTLSSDTKCYSNPNNENLIAKSSMSAEQFARKRSMTAEVGIGAGVEIRQDLKIDSLKLTDWEEKPSCVMRLYFIFIEQFEQIKEKGMKSLEGKKEGFLYNLPVGD